MGTLITGVDDMKNIQYFLLIFVVAGSIVHAVWEHDRAIYASQKGDWKYAYNLLTKTMVHNPSDTSVTYDMGVSAYRLQDYKHAAAYFDAVANNETVNKELKKQAYFNAGNSYAFQEKFDEAIERYAQALTIEPEDEHARHNKEIIERLKEQQKQQEKDSSQKNSSREDKAQNEKQESESSNNDQNDSNNPQNDNSNDNSQSKENNQDNNTSNNQSKESDFDNNSSSSQPQSSPGESSNNESSDNDEEKNNKVSSENSSSKHSEPNASSTPGEEDKDLQQDLASSPADPSSPQPQQLPPPSNGQKNYSQTKQERTQQPWLAQLLEEQDKKEAHNSAQLMRALMPRQGGGNETTRNKW
jgi:tetratricopeptide (TPR) repeat protein